MSKKISIFAFVVTNIIIIILLGILVFKTVFPSYEKVTSDSVQKDVSKKKYTAEEIINLMKQKSSNIGKVIVYNSETDPNNLLNRPNQYTSKVQFSDNRLDQSYVEENNAKGGTIEVFDSKSDLETRKKYIETISSQSSLFVQYIYSGEYAILRLDSSLTPEQAKEYEELFNSII